MGGSIVFFFSPYSKSVDHFLILECLLHPLPALTSMTLPKLTPPLSQPLEDLERGASGKQGSGGGKFPSERYPQVEHNALHSICIHSDSLLFHL